MSKAKENRATTGDDLAQERTGEAETDNSKAGGAAEQPDVADNWLARNPVLVGFIQTFAVSFVSALGAMAAAGMVDAVKSKMRPVAPGAETD